VSADGSRAVGPFATVGDVTVTITCTGPGGSATDSEILEVTAAPVVPTVTLTLSDYEIETGTATSTASWTSAHADTCTLGSGGTTGSLLYGPYSTAQTVSITISCSGAGGTATASATLNVVELEPNTILICARSPLGTTAGNAGLITWAVAYNTVDGSFRGLSADNVLLTGVATPPVGVPMESALFSNGNEIDIESSGIIGASNGGPFLVDNAGTPDATAYYFLDLTMGGVPLTEGDNTFWFEASCPELSSLPDPR